MDTLLFAVIIAVFWGGRIVVVVVILWPYPLKIIREFGGSDDIRYSN